jgi:HEAT repeat protein
MSRKQLLAVAVVVSWAVGAVLPLTAADKPAAPDKAAVDSAFDALKKFDWGGEMKVLRPLEDAVVFAQSDAAARKDLEARLVAVAKDGPRGAKDFALRQLSLIATADSVPAMAALLADKELSHMARYVLERVPGPEGVGAMRDALAKLGGRQQVGVIVSLGARRDVASVSALTALLANADLDVAAAAAKSLGTIGTPEAVTAVSGLVKTGPEKIRPVVADACLAGAERLLAAGKSAEALAVYKSLIGPEQPKPVRVAATKGMVAATGKK